MIVTFCGHRTVDDAKAVEAWLICVTEELIQQGATTFYLGGYGAFDALCKKVLLQHKKHYQGIELILIVPYLNHTMRTEEYDGTLYPELENVPLKFAILARNRWMVEQSGAVVSYVQYGWGGAAQTLAHAKRKQKQIIAYP